MWLGVWMALSVAGARSQTAHTKIQQHGGSYEWGWHLTPQGDGTAGHYYVRLPQSEQQVQYVADQHGVRASLTETPQPQDGGDQIPTQLYQVQSNETKEGQPGSQSPVDIYLLPQPSAPAIEDQLLHIPQNFQFTSIPNIYYNNNIATSAHYSVQTLHPVQVNEQIEKQTNNENTNESADHSNPLQKDDNAEQDHEHLTTNVVQVFKDHNCTNNDTPQEYNSNEKNTPVFAEEPTYNVHNINGNFGIKEGTERPLSYRSAVYFRVEHPQNNARSERYYYNEAPTTANTLTTEDERISRLVASTQDIISNEDLLKINHAVEKLTNVHNDDIIKPKPRFKLKAEQTKYDYNVQASTPRSRITVKAKIANIVDSEIEHIENDQHKEEVLQSNSNQYTFASPIVVQDSNYDDFKEQIVNNLVSTMVPYLQDGYEIVGVRNSLDENYTNSEYNKKTSDEDLVNVTPRPISQKYLAPITVALRLYNANNTETLNTIDDHDVSDSEVVTDTVKSPERERTIVEIQQSIPLDITHINDIEVHEYLDEGRSNDKGPLDLAKSLYHTYVDALRSKNTYEKNHRNNNDENQQNDSREQLDGSENIQTEVEIRPNDSHERREYARPYYNYYNEDQKLIQPIIIEKEVPITKFVDRFIEKEVPYPERVEVIQHVPVDRPVAVPVPYEKYIDRPVEVTRFVNKPYPVEVPRLYPVEVPYPVEQKVYVDRPVHVPYPVDRIVEKQVVHQVPVPTPVAVPVEVPVQNQVLFPIPIETPVPYPVEVEKPVTVEKIVHREVAVPYPVEKRVPYPVHYETKVPVPYPVEKRIPVPVERVVEKPVTVTKYVEKPVHVEVPVPQPVPVTVHVPQPYPVDRIVEKKVPYPVPFDRIVEKKVHVPYPVDRVVEKIVEKPVVVTKYVDKPYPVEKRVPYPVEKIVEKKVPYPVEVPFEVKVPYPVEKNVDRPVYVPIRVPYHYEHPRASHNSLTQQSQNVAQYQRYSPEQHKQGIPPPYLNKNEVQHFEKAPQSQQYVQHTERPKSQPVQTTHWGNLYASSYQYINSTPKYEFKKSPGLANYIHYLTNNNNQRQQEYYGPPPMAQTDNVWEENRKYLVELKLRRADRTPKASNLRIEYGFKPPLIPSTEIDLDGLPVKKESQ